MDLAPSSVKPLFALVDCNNFYVSCERVFQPRLNGKPVVVLSNNDGCVISRSAEAKAMGVGMGIPWHEARPLTRQGLIALSSNYALYGDLSARVMNILGDMAPRQEVYSIDETFLDLGGVSDPEQLGYAMRQRVLQWTHIPTCVGLGSTRTRAKLANQIAKKSGGSGVFHLETLPPDVEQALLARLPVGEVWGVGRRWQDKLVRMGIRSVADLKSADADAIRAQTNVVLARTVLELQGVSCLSLMDMAEPQAQLMHSRSFGRPVQRLEHLEEAVREFMVTAAAKLRQRGLQTALVSVSLQAYAHRESELPYRNSMALPLAAPTQDSRLLARLAKEGIGRLFRPGLRYKKTGVLLTGLSAARPQQLDWLDGGDTARSRALMSAVDRINREMGRQTVQWGLPVDAGHWRMKQDRRSPRFTSSWEELVVVKA